MKVPSHIADGLDLELSEHKKSMDTAIKEIDVLAASNKSDEEKLQELEKIREKINKVRLEIDNIKNIIILLAHDSQLN